MTTGSLSLLSSPALAQLQIRPAHLPDVTRIFDLARSLISKDVAAPSMLERIFRRNRSTLLVVDETMGSDTDSATTETTPVTGFIATLPLTAAGVRALWTGTFSGCDVDPGWIAGEQDTPEAVYIWGLAGETRTAKAAIWKSALHLEREAYPGVPYYATAGSSIGETLLTRLGYRRLSDTIPSVPKALFARDSHIAHSAAA